MHNARPSESHIAKRVFLTSLRVVGAVVTAGISEGIIALVKHATHKKDSQPRVAAPPSAPLARPSADVTNSALATALDKGTLSENYRLALSEGIGDLRASFGAEIVKENATIEDMPNRYYMKKALAQAIKDSPEEVAPERLRAMVAEKGTAFMAEECLKKFVVEHCASIGYKPADFDILNGGVLNSAKIQMADALHGAKTKEEAEQVIANFQTKIESYLFLKKLIDNTERSEIDRVLTELSQGTGVSKEKIQQEVQLRKLNNSHTYVVDDIMKGVIEADVNTVSSAFRAATDKFIQNKLQLFHSIDTLNISSELKDSWRNAVLSSVTLSKGDMLTNFQQIGSKVDASKLLEMLNAPAGEFTPEDILGYMKTLGAQLFDQCVAHYGAQGWQELGGDGWGDARTYTTQALFDAVPGLKEALFERSDTLLDELNEIASRESLEAFEASGDDDSDPTIAAQNAIFSQAIQFAQTMLLGKTPPAIEQNQELIRTLGNPDMPAIHAMALDQTLIEAKIHFGEDCLPEGSARQVLEKAYDPTTSNYALKTLNKAIRESDTVVTAADMARMSETALHHAAVRGAARSILQERAQTLGQNNLTADNLNTIMERLNQRYRDFWLSLGAAKNRAEVAEKLQSYPEIDAMLRVESDIQESWNTGMAQIYSSIGVVTGLPENELREKLNVTSLENASFLYLRKDLRDVYSKSANGIESFPSTELIKSSFQRIVDTFIERRGGLYTSVDTMNLSPEVKAQWKEQALSNYSLKSSGDFLSRCYQIGTSMQDAGFPLALQDSTTTEQELIGQLQSLGTQFDVLAHQFFTAQEYEKFGTDEMVVIDRFAMEAFIDTNPDLVRAITDHADRIRNLIGILEEQLIEIQSNLGKTEVNSPQMAELREQYNSVMLTYQVAQKFIPQQA